MNQGILSLVAFMPVLLAGCAVNYTPVEPRSMLIDEPGLGELTTAHVGDPLLRKGLVIEEEVVNVKTPVDGIAYDVHAGVYPILGELPDERFYSPLGIVKGVFSDPFVALSVKQASPNQVCVVTVFAVRACYDAQFSIEHRASAKETSFQQTLIYSGRVGDKINIGYREFSSSIARPAFNNDVEYDLSVSKQIGYKGALLEVIDANNSSITYKVIRSFK